MRPENRAAMRDSQRASKSRCNHLKWIFVCLLLFAGIIANSYYDSVALAVRAAVGILIFLAILAIVFRTTQGVVFWNFAKGARIEMRKVVWPTRQETIQTTLVVVAMVVIAALILWGFDAIFYSLVGWLTGQRG